MVAVVYRAYDADGRLLYVGQSINAPGRISNHQSSTPWWTQVANLTLEHHDSKEQALVAEAEAIGAEAPVYNIARGGRNVVPEDELRRRQQDREAQRAEREEFERTHYRAQRQVVCTNCGEEPVFLPKGKLVAEVLCPRCEVPGLERVAKTTRKIA